MDSPLAVCCLLVRYSIISGSQNAVFWLPGQKQQLRPTVNKIPSTGGFYVTQASLNCLACPTTDKYKSIYNTVTVITYSGHGAMWNPVVNFTNIMVQSANAMVRHSLKQFSFTNKTKPNFVKALNQNLCSTCMLYA